MTSSVGEKTQTELDTKGGRTTKCSGDKKLRNIVSTKGTCTDWPRDPSGKPGWPHRLEQQKWDETSGS